MTPKIEQIKQNKILSIVIYFSAFLGMQRVLLPDIYVYACLIPFLIALNYYKNKKIRNTLFLIAIFLSVDNGGSVYNITPSIIRYLIYVTVYISFFEGMIVDRDKATKFTFVVFFLGIITLSQIDLIDGPSFVRDVIIIILVMSFIIKSKKSPIFSLDYEYLYSFLIVFVFGELSMYFVARSFVGADYLSYNSTKSLVVFATFYSIHNKRLLNTAIVFIFTTFLLVLYSTRMIIVTYFLMIILSLFNENLSKGKKIIWGVFLFGITLVFSTFFLENTLSNKAVALFVHLFDGNDLLYTLNIIDRVRFTETSLFFGRDVFHILFGSGLGSGLLDSSAEFNFVKYYQTAFSIKELNSGIYYNLHDVWLDIGLRFGLISIIISYYFILKNIYSKNKISSTLTLSLFVLFSCAFFSTQGLLLITFFAHAFQSSLIYKDS